MAQTDNLTGTIAAFFESSGNARQAVGALQDAGFSSAHLGVAHRGEYGSASVSSADASRPSAQTGTKGHDFSTWDKVKNWFTGDEPEPYENERPRGDLAGREVVDPDSPSGNLPGARYNYSSSDLPDSFGDLQIPGEQSRYFSHRLGRDSDGAVVTVQAGPRRREAEEILTQYGGDLGAGAATYDYGDSGYSQESGIEEYAAERPDNIQLLGEVLRVHKDRVSRGEVRLRKEVVTDTQQVKVPVTREELVIERHPGGERATPAGSIGETEIRVPLSEERVTLDKDTVVREEVSVAKRPVEDVRDVSGEVRREELVVDDTTKRKDDPNRRVA
ncbi:YsnF/AvaK domain-containing protein [Acidobacteria bacterium AB60]|nr:YsnF/AvaK domain-containing protein [Acidobacteria bacterium AB60]